MADDMDALLAKSLGNKGTGAQKEKKKAGRVKTLVPTPKHKITAKSVTQSMSLIAQDMAALDQIIDHVRDVRGKRIGFSQAMRIALILAPVEAERIGKAYDQALTYDARRSS